MFLFNVTIASFILVPISALKDTYRQDTCTFKVKFGMTQDPNTILAVDSKAMEFATRVANTFARSYSTVAVSDFDIAGAGRLPDGSFCKRNSLYIVIYGQNREMLLPYYFS